jgi:hypothetical protein
LLNRVPDVADNTEHCHSVIALLAPETIHREQTKEVLASRTRDLAAAFETHPARFTRTPTAKQPPGAA